MIEVVERRLYPALAAALVEGYLTGSVVPFCSETCRDRYKAEYPGALPREILTDEPRRCDSWGRPSGEAKCMVCSTVLA